MTITTSALAPHVAPTVAPTPIAASISSPVSLSMPDAPAGLKGRQAGAAQSDSPGRMRAQLPAAPALVPYPSEYPIPGGGSKTLVGLDGEFSKETDARLAAHRVVIETARAKLAKQLAQADVPVDSALAKFASGSLDHVYVDSKNFKALARAAGPVDGRPDQFPVYVDTKRNQLVVNIEQAFVPGDELSEPARRGLQEALGVDSGPHYKGHRISSTTKGADFFKPNTHSLIEGKHPNVTDFVHPNYFDAPSTKALGKEIAVHRGLMDNREGVPENSLSAIQAAFDAGYRSLELDVQVTSDGTPVLLHDFTIGRMTDDPQDRLVSHVTFAELSQKNLVIRNPVDGNFVETDQKVASIEQALDDVARTKPGMSIALDCKETTAEAAFDILLRRPELREMTALKLYSKAYAGGFDQFLGNLYRHYGIDPKSPEDKHRRLELLGTLSQIRVVPVFSQEVLTNPQLKQFFPAHDAKTQDSDEGLAETAQAWLDSWTTMKPVIVEAVSTDKATPEGRGMAQLNEHFAEPANPYHGVATSAAYRYEDFSVPQKDGDKKYYTWQIFGGITDATGDKWAVNRGTAGAFRKDGDNLLTDQPEEEVWASQHDERLPRGHTGLELDVPPGTAIDTTRDDAIVKERLKEFLAEKEKRKPDAQLIADVRAGREADKAGAVADEAKSPSPNPWVVGGVAAAATAATTAAVGYLATRPGLLRGTPDQGADHQRNA